MQPSAVTGPVPTPLDLAGLPLLLVSGARQVAAVLHGVAAARRDVSLSGSHLPGNISTRLHVVDLAAGQIFLREPGLEQARQALRQERHCNLLCWPGDSPILGTLELQGRQFLQGTACLRAPLPPFLLMPQLRAEARVRAVARRHLTLRVHHPSNEPLYFVVSDFSAAGFGLQLPHLPLCRIAPGDTWPAAMLSDAAGCIGSLDLEVRHVSISAAGELSLGVALRAASPGTRQRLRRLAGAQQANLWPKELA